MRKYIPRHYRSLIVILIAGIARTGCQESWQERLRRETRLMSLRQCPHYITRGLIADSLVYDPATNTRYDYLTFIDSLIDLSQLTPENMRMAHMESVNQIRQSIDINMLKSHQATFMFIYRLKSTGEVIATDSVTAEEY